MMETQKIENGVREGGCGKAEGREKWRRQRIGQKM